MIRNFFIVALRNFVRQRLYSVLNIVGLTTGLTSSSFLLLYVWDELSYDQMFSQADQTFRVNTYVSVGDTNVDAAVTMAATGPAMQEDYPEVLAFTRVNNLTRPLVINGEDQFYEERYYYADSTFLDIFDFPLLAGERHTALSAPHSIVLSESLAIKYFGEVEVVGKTLKIGPDEELHTVTAVISDPYPNTHMKPNALISYSSLGPGQNTNWSNVNDYLYIVLPEGYDPSQMDRKLQQLFEKYLSETFKEINAYARFSLMPLKDIHLRSGKEAELEPGGSMDYIYVFSAIAVFILVIASINYMNIATSRGVTRAKEVGIRKALGSHKKHLRYQFLTESLLITASSGVLSLVLMAALLPLFDQVSGKEIPMMALTEPLFLFYFVLILVVVGFISGSYPAFYLSSFNPVYVLKGRNVKLGGGKRLRRWLVIAQFCISLVMIICTSVVYSQLDFMVNKNLGFNKDQLIKIELNGSDLRDKYSVLKEQLLEYPQIMAVASGSATPGGNDFGMQGMSLETNEGDRVEKVYVSYAIDGDYLSTLQIPLSDGRDFLPTVGNDTSGAVIVNEQLVHDMGWDDPIGMKIYSYINQGFDTQESKVVGVIKDFHLRNLQEPIGPMVIYMRLNNSRALVRVRSDNIDETITYIEEVWEEVIPNRPMELSFVSQDFEDQYLEEERKGRLFALFSWLTILIACLGLFGLTSYSSEVRKKEIGVRKAMGASFADIIVLMSKDFLKLIIISMLLAFPVAWYYMTEWLDQFSYQVSMSVFTFLLPALLCILITMLTIGYHSLMAALSNPAVSLKDE